ncbi:PAX3- and PAX7-binding protein 1 [Trichinella papuae]|uniref:PAX3-and PAX7-binding protein 1 n=1 Tax=Trichinella papuae TaxID=268474 RepID=A0A0V1MWZ1_9BILA|nr:PAX3- and PAX7-binding protein 1 [Trichinella papuae]
MWNNRKQLLKLNRKWQNKNQCCGFSFTGTSENVVKTKTLRGFDVEIKPLRTAQECADAGRATVKYTTAVIVRIAVKSIFQIFTFNWQFCKIDFLQLNLRTRENLACLASFCTVWAWSLFDVCQYKRTFLVVLDKTGFPRRKLNCFHNAAVLPNRRYKHNTRNCTDFARRRKSHRLYRSSRNPRLKIQRILKDVTDIFEQHHDRRLGMNNTACCSFAVSADDRLPESLRIRLDTLGRQFRGLGCSSWSEPRLRILECGQLPCNGWILARKLASPDNCRQSYDRSCKPNNQMANFKQVYTFHTVELPSLQNVKFYLSFHAERFQDQIYLQMFRKSVAKGLRKKVHGSDSDGSSDGNEISESTSISNVVPVCSNLLSFAEEEEASNALFKSKKPTRLHKLSRRNELSTKKAVEKKKEIVVQKESNSVEQQSSVERSQIHPFRIVDVTKDYNEAAEFSKIVSGGLIPDAKVIHMARKRREAAREERSTSAEFIPLENTLKYRNKKGRLIREEDDDDDSEDEKCQFYSRNENENDRLRHSLDEKDDELEIWEMEQIRKGVSVSVIAQYHRERAVTMPENCSQFGRADFINENLEEYVNMPQPMDLEVKSSELHVEQPPLALQKRNYSSLFVQFDEEASRRPFVGKSNFESIHSKIKEKLEEFKETEQQRMKSLHSTRQHREEQQEIYEKLSEQKPILMEQYNFFITLRSYIIDLLDCLDEKVPMIDALNKEAIALMQKRTTFFKHRREIDVQDQHRDCLIALGSSLPSTNLQESEKLTRVAEREARRTRRRLARERLVVSIAHHDGMSSDDEEPSRCVVDFTQLMMECREKANIIFNDVNEDFKSIEAVCERFSNWMDGFPATYTKCFGNLCLPKLAVPYVQQEMIGWTPTEDGMQPLESFVWFQQLLHFGYKPGAQHSQTDELDVIYIVPNVVLKVVCPLLTELVNKVWDPTSGKQTRRLVDFLDNLFTNYPTLTPQSEQVCALVDAIYHRMEETISTELFTPIFPKNMSDGKQIQMVLNFCERQFWFGVKVLENVVTLRTVLSESAVKALALPRVLNSHLLVSLNTVCGNNSDAQIFQKADAIAKLLPDSWLSELGKETTGAVYDSFCRTAVQLALRLIKANQNNSKQQELLKKTNHLLKRFRLHHHVETYALSNDLEREFYNEPMSH